MDMIGFDLHKRESQLCTLHRDGSATEQRIERNRDRLTAVFGNRGAARILIEASTESEWVAQCLEALGHEVIIADPNYAPMYATRSRRVKTDRRDARTLAEALRLGAYRPAHRVSAARRHVRAELAVREALVRTRTRYVAIAKAFVRRDGLRVPSSESHRAGISSQLEPGPTWGLGTPRVRSSRSNARRNARRTGPRHILRPIRCTHRFAGVTGSGHCSAGWDSPADNSD